MCGFAAYHQGLGYPDLDELVKIPKPIIFQMELLSVVLPGDYEPEVWTLSLDQKLNLLPTWKEEGNAFYKAGDYDLAIERYSQALGCLEQLLTRERPGSKEHEELELKKIPFLMNYSQCMICKKEYYKAIEHLNTVIEKESDNVKALFRRATAHHAVWNPSEARKDYNQAMELDPSLTSTVEKSLAKLSLEEKQKDMSDKERYRRAFSDIKTSR